MIEEVPEITAEVENCFARTENEKTKKILRALPHIFLCDPNRSSHKELRKD